MLSGFREVVAVDFEFTALPGERPGPICCVAYELISKRQFRIFQPFPTTPPWATGPDVLFISYFASAELGCYLALGWPMPQHVLDLYVEFRWLTNGLSPPGAKLINVMTYFGLDALDATEKEEMQKALGGDTWQGKYTPEEILNYCETDSAALQRLFPVMLPYLDVPRGLIRGRYMRAVAAMEYHGTPIDVPTLNLLRERWVDIKRGLIAAVDADFNVYEGTVFKHDKFAQLLASKHIAWPLTETGRLATDDDTFKQMAKVYPFLSPLRELRHTLGELRLEDLTVGSDHRNRCLLSPFRAVTGRNQPSNSKFIFGPSVWIRGLVKPPPGYAVAYIDWSQQEIGIAAALSGDPAKQAAYLSDDSYLTFGKQAGVIPPDATKETHPHERALFKSTLLGMIFGMGWQSLAVRVGQPDIVGRNLLRLHHETYPPFWAWSDAAVDTAMLQGRLHAVFGWAVHVTAKMNPRSLRNFPMQANGAEMMRLAACFGIERGIEICAPIHDAFLICSPLDRIDADVAAMREAMAEASRIVLSGFELKTEAHIIRYPDRFMDEDRGRVMWTKVMSLIGDRQVQESGHVKESAA
jgi:DNA polymerase I